MIVPGVVCAVVAAALVACGSPANEATRPVETSAGIAPAVGGYGARVPAGAAYTVVLFVIAKGARAVDYVGVSCARNGRISAGPFKVGEDVTLTDGRFRASSSDVTVEGRFTSPTAAEGTVTGLSATAQSCGIPGQGGSWRSQCELTVSTEPELAAGNLVFGDASSVGEGGTAYVRLEISSGGRRIVGNRIDSGSCG